MQNGIKLTNNILINSKIWWNLRFSIYMTFLYLWRSLRLTYVSLCLKWYRYIRCFSQFLSTIVDVITKYYGNFKQISQRYEALIWKICKNNIVAKLLDGLIEAKVNDLSLEILFCVMSAITLIIFLCGLIICYIACL